MEEIARELAKILIPTPVRGWDEGKEQFAERFNMAHEQRRTLVGELLLAARASVLDDPVLARLSELAAQKQDIQRQIRLIIAYGREFIRPEPYRLRTLAAAAGLSISGARTVYSPEDLAAIATQIGRRDNKGSIFPQSPGKPLTTRASTFDGEQWWVPGGQDPADQPG
jgi:hypothetical protein